ncbi:MAG: GNAT family N-acetyltransferase [Thermoanaerobaculia bacterium]
MTDVEVLPSLPASASLASSAPVARRRSGRYELRAVSDEAALDAVQRLRYRVFNLELGEGLASSRASGRDEDRFDRQCHHLLVEDREVGEVVGTYRLQTAAMAAAADGFYCDGEYDLGALPARVSERALEIGRACIAREHRNRTVLFLLWQGLAEALVAAGGRYLFGCCSLASQDPSVGLVAAARLEREGWRHPHLWVPARDRHACVAPPGPAAPTAVELPALFRSYLRYGARVASPPAIDREFKTIDFLVLLDIETLDVWSRRMFFAPPA